VCNVLSLLCGCCLPPGTDLDSNAVKLMTPAGDHLLELIRSDRGVHMCAMCIIVLNN